MWTLILGPSAYMVILLTSNGSYNNTFLCLYISTCISDSGRSFLLLTHGSPQQTYVVCAGVEMMFFHRFQIPLDGTVRWEKGSSQLQCKSFTYTVLGSGQPDMGVALTCIWHPEAGHGKALRSELRCSLSQVACHDGIDVSVFHDGCDQVSVRVGVLRPGLIRRGVRSTRLTERR